MSLIIVSIVLILAGIVMAVWGSKVTPAVLGMILKIAGVLLICLGLVLLLTPVIVWLNAQLRAMFNV